MYTKDGVQEPAPSKLTEEKQAPQTAPMRELIAKLADNTGCQGVPNIRRAGSQRRRAFWMIIVFAGIGMMIWKIQEAVVKYYSYPVVTKLTYVYSPQLNFPAVTICNHNPIKVNFMAECGAAVQDLMEDDNRGSANVYSKDARENVSSTDWEKEESQPADGSSIYEKDDSDFQAREALSEYMAQWPKWKTVKLGHNITMALMDCTFQGKRCSPRNFTWFSNYLYGNCYTFNVDRWDTQGGLNVTKVGPMYGLTLELFLEQFEYSSLTTAAGFRVLIHNQTNMPFPEDFGFSIGPGQKTSVGIKRVEITRPEPNYGDCKKFTYEENKKINGFVDELPHIEYSTSACKKTCYQQRLVKRCGCYDSKYPYNETYLAYSEISKATDDLKPCNSSFDCLLNTEDEFANNNLGCSTQCPSECFVVNYERHVSTSMYPAANSKDDVLRRVQKISDTLYDWIADNYADKNAMWTLLKHNVLTLEVYYEDLNYETIETSGSYGSMELFSDLGGQTGFWLGLSVIALFELVELLIDIFVVIGNKITGKSERRIGGVANDNENEKHNKEYMN